MGVDTGGIHSYIEGRHSRRLFKGKIFFEGRKGTKKFFGFEATETVAFNAWDGRASQPKLRLFFPRGASFSVDFCPPHYSDTILAFIRALFCFGRIPRA